MRLAYTVAFSLACLNPAYAVVIGGKYFEDQGGDYNDIPGSLIDVMLPLRVKSFESQWASVGRLTGNGYFCTATWLGNDPTGTKSYILTASHCGTGTTSTKSFSTYSMSESGVVTSKKITGLGPRYTPTNMPYQDNPVALDTSIMELDAISAPVLPNGQALEKPRIYIGSDIIGTSITLVGHGNWGVNRGDGAEFTGVSLGSVIKRAAGEMIATSVSANGLIVNAKLQYTLPESSGAWAQTGGGDSGGAYWIEKGGVWSILATNIGTISGGSYTASQGALLAPVADWIRFIYPDALFYDYRDKAVTSSSENVFDNLLVQVAHSGGLGNGPIFVSALGEIWATTDSSLNGNVLHNDGEVQIWSDTEQTIAELTGDGSIEFKAPETETGLATLTLAREEASEYGGAFQGDGRIVLTGEGLTTFSGNSSSFSGLTSVLGGTLVVNGTLGGSLSLEDGALLAGSGTIGSTTLKANSIIAPGNSIGVLSVNGDVTFEPYSTYEVEIAASGEADRISATGTATLGSANVALMTLDPTVSYQNGQSYVILDAASIAGTFSAPTGLDSAFLTSQLDYTDDSVILNLYLVDNPDQDTDTGQETPGEPGSPETPGEPGNPETPDQPVFPREARSANQFAVATALDSLDQTEGSSSLALYNAVLFANADNARQAFDSLSGEGHASVKSGLLEVGSPVRRSINNRLRGAFDRPIAVRSSDNMMLKYISNGTQPADPLSDVVGWGETYGSWGQSDTDGNVATQRSETEGAVFGFDAIAFETGRLGVFAGYDQSAFTISDRAYRADVDNYQLGVYGGTVLGGVALRGGLAYIWHDLKTQRSVFLPSSTQSLSAEYNARSLEAFGEVAYRFDTQRIALEPFANLAYVNLRTDDFTEKGDSAALSGKKDTSETAFMTLGLTASHDLDVFETPVTLSAMVGWRHVYGDVEPAADIAFSAGNAFKVFGAPIAQDTVAVELNLEAAITSKTTVGLSYSGQFGDGATQQNASARLQLAY